MIVKHIPIRKLNKSSFSGLVNYITNSMDRNERVGEVRITNCESDNPKWAAIEVENVQAQNKRSLVDKTYHLLVSFRESEHPSVATMRIIEDRLCGALGYQNHQRVSAVHHDTDHVHIHIAINKVHPIKLTTKQPYNDYKIFAAQCAELEQEFGLEIDNHVTRRTRGEAKARDMEIAAGVESLIGWIKRGCLSELQAASSWQELHKVLATNNLQLVKRGNGLVIKDDQGIAAKVSSIERSFSFNALEKKLGTFQPYTEQDIKIANRYEIKPMASRIDTSSLWSLYQREKLDHKQRYVVLSERAKQRKERRVHAAKKSSDLKRVGIKLVKGRLAKTILYKSVSDGFKKEIQTIRQDYQADRLKLYENGKPLVWHDWLKKKALEGNTEALDVLRQRYDRVHLKMNFITSENSPNQTNRLSNSKIENVTKRGTIHYQINKSVLRDDGKAIRLADNTSNDVIETALKMSIQRFGSQLTINGTQAFRKQVADVATEAKLNIVFSESKIETQTIKSSTTIDEAVSHYIEERNRKRKAGINDISPHRRYDRTDAGKYPFAGTRQIENKIIVLLKTETEMLVLQVNDSDVDRVKKIGIGKKVSVTKHGLIRSLKRKIS